MDPSLTLRVMKKLRDTPKVDRDTLQKRNFQPSREGGGLRLELGQPATLVAGEFAPDRQVVADLLRLIERQIEVSKEIEDSRTSGELDGGLGRHEQVIEHRLPVKVGGDTF